MMTVKNRYIPVEKEIFHVHTYRCKHAGDIQDFEYIEKAIEVGSNRIVFTDHAPFPENPFGNRMSINELDSYVDALNVLKKKYTDKIDVLIGLEIEYLPSYVEYYKELSRTGKFDVLMIGQHFYEVSPNKYSFTLDKDLLKQREVIECANAIIEGIKTGIFNVVAHPDRIFRRRKEWTADMEKVSREIIQAASEYGVLLEQNESSKSRKYQYWEEFWKLVPQNIMLKGLDAHSLKEIKIL